MINILNWKNVAENLVLILIAMTIGVLLGAFVAIKVTDIVLDNQKQIIETAIKKETTSIKNEFKNEFGKIKNKGTEPINIIIDPNSNSVIQKDSVKESGPEEKDGFFKRIFKRKNKQ